jgi:guanylate kinase
MSRPGGVIIYGPPAAGKDTVTAALGELDRRYCLFQRLKVGGGRRSGYRMATDVHLDQLRASGEVLWENSRYGATYAVDRREVLRMVSASEIPVVHLGQLPAIEALVKATPAIDWRTIYLWCPRAEAAERITARETGDTEERLRVWDATEPFINADLAINTAVVDPVRAATCITVMAGA